MTLSALFGFSWGGTLIGKRQSEPDNPQNATDLCERLYLSTTVIGEELWLNGGEYKVGNDYVSFDYIQRIDLSKSWTMSSPDLTTYSKPPLAAYFRDSCAWNDGVHIYQYGGWEDSEDPESSGLWKYDGSEWSNISTGAVGLLSSGGCTDAPMIKKSYAYGGLYSSRIMGQGKTNLLRARGKSDLIEFDWETKSLRNVTFEGRVNAPETLDNLVVYVPVGGQGILVPLSGSQRGGDLSESESFSEIRLFDIASSTWYIQSASAALPVDGMPVSRVLTCAVVMTAADNSSYNIYMFGGSAIGDKDTDFRDMWILSLPSFKWIKLDASDSSYSASKRAGHSCNLIGNRQMAVIGGAYGAEAQEQCETASVFLFDMATLAWKDRFDPGEAAYELPEKITDVIGGDKLGNASRIKPEAWGDGVENIFVGSDIPQVTAPAPAPAPAPGSGPGPGPSTSIGAVVGGVVGGVAALAAIAFGLFFLRRRRRSVDDEPKMNPDQKSRAQELNAEPTVHELDHEAAPVYELTGTTLPWRQAALTNTLHSVN
ncbi:hypothetical protein DFP73DRAFT_532050 [Morchella snyderi]|nr:hypothetical protein DFP73DRAFT_532050 [Morchella snyderi]